MSETTLISATLALISTLLIIIGYFLTRIINKVDETYKELVNNQLVQTKLNTELINDIRHNTDSIKEIHADIYVINERLSNHDVMLQSSYNSLKVVK